MAAGNRNRLSFKAESTWGTDPSGNYQELRKLGDAGITLDRAQIRTAEWNSRRAVTGMRLGNKAVGVNVPFELSYGTYDTLIESAFYSTWTTAASAITGLSATVVAGTTNTIGATGINAGIVAGDWVKISGFVSPYTANNGFFKVTVSASNLLTLGQAKSPDGTSLLAACTSQSGISVQRVGYIVPGTTAKSLAFAEDQLDLATGGSTQALGCIADSFNLSLAPDAIITGNFAFLGKTFNGPANATYGGTVVAAGTDEVMQSNDAYTKLWLDGSATCAATAFDFSLSNGGSRVMPVFCNEPNKITADDALFTGNVTMLREDAAMLTKYLNETDLAISSKILDKTGTNGYALEFPKVRITAHNLQRAKDNVLVTLPWTALEYSTTFNACKIWKLV